MKEEKKTISIEALLDKAASESKVVKLRFLKNKSIKITGIIFVALLSILSGYYIWKRNTNIKRGSTDYINFGVESPEYNLLRELKSLDNFIVFSSNRDGNYEIYRMNVDGSGTQRLTYNKYDDFEPSVSPDGKKIVFSKLRTDYGPDTFNRPMKGRGLWVMDSDGGNPQPLLAERGLEYTSPVWSFDGKEIAFVMGKPNDWKHIIFGASPSTIEQLKHIMFYFKKNELKVKDKTYKLISEQPFGYILRGFIFRKPYNNIYVEDNHGQKIELIADGYNNIDSSWGPPVPILKDKK